MTVWLRVLPRWCPGDRPQPRRRWRSSARRRRGRRRRSPDQVAAKPGSHGFRGRLAITFALTAAFFVVELVVGLLSGSLALVADAGHMATDVLALGASLVATQIAGRPDGSGRRTYGRYRSEVFAAGFAVLLMVGVGAFIVYEAISRMGTDPDVSSTPMVIVGLIGLAVNAVGLVLLRNGSKQSINIRGAYLEVLGDAAGSVGVLIAGLLISWTGSSVWDVVVAVIIGVFVLIRAFGLGRSVLRVLRPARTRRRRPGGRRSRSRRCARRDRGARPAPLGTDLRDECGHRAPGFGARCGQPCRSRCGHQGVGRRAPHRSRRLCRWSRPITAPAVRPPGNRRFSARAISRASWAAGWTGRPALRCRSPGGGGCATGRCPGPGCRRSP